MKISVVSHSLVAPRQGLFFDYLADRVGITLQQIYPSRWGALERDGGHPVTNEGDLHTFAFKDDALRAIERFNPDVLYVQNEAYCKVSGQMMHISKRLGSKFVLFVWENVDTYRAAGVGVQYLLKDTDLVVCGNGRAETLIQPYNKRTLRCIQVGLDTKLFAPLPKTVPEYDVMFNARMVPEKGGQVLEDAVKGTGWKVLWPQPYPGVPYDELPKRYAMARVLVAPSIDVPEWREQHAGYSTLEALACGLFVATTDSAAIVEALVGDESCPGVVICRQNDVDSLSQALANLLAESGAGRNLAGREWVTKKYGFEAVGDKLIEAFAKL